MKPVAKKWAPAAALTISILGMAGCGGGSDPVDAAQSLTSTVGVANGTVVGNERDAAGILNFKGIPYAAAPVGDLRWRAPQPAPNWTGTRDARQYGSKCWANGTPAPVVADPTVSEDCLFLNVWSGARTSGERRPVMVWLHGGGFQFGTSGDPRWEGNNLAKKGVVLVSLNYRLGVFGHLARPDLAAESGGKSSGMYGLQDHLAALQWVKNNIASFGGDPANITLFGESAGAHAVGMLSASPLAAGTFHKAIGQSGAFWESEFGPLPSRAAAEQKGLALGTTLGAASLAALRAVPALQLASATNAAAPPFAPPFGPSLDGYVLPEEPAARFFAGRQNDVPLLVGQNVAEGNIFAVPGRALPNTPTGFTAAVTKVFGASNVSSLLGFYPAGTDAQAAQSSVQLLGDLIIGLQTWTWGVVQKATGKSPVYSYYFKQASPYTPLAVHVSEVPYVFQNLVPKGTAAAPVLPSAQDQALADTMSSYWTSFAKSGNPNQPGLPVWPEYSGAGGNVMGLGATVALEPEPFTARYQFLNKFRDSTGSLTVKF
uniref:carboxylesterase/lipase family protein n=1 Tax=Polaromonas sp. TaxID=1869339 RepID=UPI0021050450|nr:carboxylesterase family protein [Polaromonas sp.]